MKPATGDRRSLTNGAIVLLAASLVAMLGAAWQAQRAWHAERTRLEAAVRDYTSFAAWSYAEHVDQAVTRGLWDLLSPVNHGDGLHTSAGTPGAADLSHYLPWDSAGCYCHTAALPPSAFFVLTLGADTLSVAPNLYSGELRGGVLVDEDAAVRHERLADSAALLAARLAPPAQRAEIVERLTRHARAKYRFADRMAALIRASPRGPSLIGYTLMPTVRGDTLLYGVLYDPARTAAAFADVLDYPELLPATFTRGRANRQVLRAEVVSVGGESLFRTDPPPAPDRASEHALTGRLSWLRVRTELRPEVAAALVAGGLPRSPLPLLIGLTLVAAILGVTALAQIRRAAQLARARADFVSSVSHELRTPLAQIRLYLETLRLGRFRTDEQRERALETIDRETGRLASLVENVLHFERSSRGARSPATRRVVAGDEVEAAVAAFRPLAAGRGVALEVRSEGDTAVMAVPEQLRQVLTNLLDNALKYGPPGQTVRVEAARRNGRVHVSVEDAGPGVPAGERPRVWDAFWRGADASVSGAAGSGIGLSVVREIVERHGGEVSLDSSRAGGARFGFSLPAA